MREHWLVQPEWSWNQPNKHNPTYVHEWVQSIHTMNTPPELLIYGAPLSRSSISVSGASLYPMEFRRIWKGFATYNIEKNIDLSSFLVGDAGDISMHTTDISMSHDRIKQSTAYLCSKYPYSRTCMIGGDHSTTACAVKGIQQAFPNETIGILQFDTHLDVRDPKIMGPSNGTPIRQLIEENIVKGENIVNIGPHGYYNAKPLVDFANKHHIKIITLKTAREAGVIQTVLHALKTLSEKVDRIYVTVDLDVLDISFAPGVPASTPGGMTTEELFDSLLEIGSHVAVQHIDFVCLDPSKDTPVNETVKIGGYAWMQFVTGCVLRKIP